MDEEHPARRRAEEPEVVVRCTHAPVDSEVIARGIVRGVAYVVVLSLLLWGAVWLAMRLVSRAHPRTSRRERSEPRDAPLAGSRGSSLALLTPRPPVTALTGISLG